RKGIQTNARIAHIASRLQSSFCQQAPESRPTISGSHVDALQLTDIVYERPHRCASTRQALDFCEKQHPPWRRVHPPKGIQLLGESLKAEVDRQTRRVLLKQDPGQGKIGVSGSSADNFSS